MGLTRRAFLKLTMGLLAAAGVPAERLIAATSGSGELDTGVDFLMGRAQYALAVRTTPSWGGAVVRWLQPEESFTILAAVLGDRPERNNDVWYLTPMGYVHSAWVQPMRYFGPQPPADPETFPEWGFWAEVCRPTVSARESPSPYADEDYVLVYGSVHHVISMYQDPSGASWYQIFDELPPPTTHWVRAQHMRRLTEWDTRPLSPHLPLEQKQVVVNLAGQTVICYEGEQAVYFTRCASGAVFAYEDGSSEDFRTPQGAFVVLLKQPSRHMQGGVEGEDDYFDLPGVPWNTFFTYSGIAIHGTYWHNDYGIPRSHGCVNVSPEAAFWIYRWTSPIAPYEDDYVQSDRTVGSRIIVT